MLMSCFNVYTPGFYYPHGEPCLTRREAEKELSRRVRESAAHCRKTYKRCGIVGKIKSGVIRINVGGKRGYHLWQAYYITESTHRGI